MKKILSLLLAASLVLSISACKKEKNEEVIDVDTEVQQAVNTPTPQESEMPETTEEVKKEEEKKPQSTLAPDPTAKPTEKPATTLTPTAKPTEKPVATPTPTVKPTEKPTVAPTQAAQKTVGNTLLAEFKKIAGSSSALSVAEKLVSNPIIAFSGAAAPVEEGYLTGFGNNEIKGFKEGAMFAPMIGTIPFVGYVFTLGNESSASAFISTLKSSADLRWNICTEAEEMITGNVGNKVFFVMSPKSFDEE